MSRAETNLFVAAAEGHDDDCTTFSEKDRIIRGALLAWLCTDPDASKYVTYHGISIVGAEIAGEVDLAFAKILFPLRIQRCEFQELIDLQSSDVSSLDLTCSKATRGVNLIGAVVGGDVVCNGGQFVGTDDAAAIEAGGAHIKGFVFLRKDPDNECEFIAEGGVDIVNAKIDRDLDCDGGHFVGHKATLAFNAESAQIDGSVFLHSAFSAEGQVRLVGAKISGNLDCHGSRFVSTGKAPAIDAASAKILGSAWLTKGTEINASFTANGGVDFSDATIGGNFDCTGSQFLSNGEAAALNANGLEVKGYVSFANEFKARGGVLFSRATIGGDLNCIGGTFVGSDNIQALDANGASIRGSAFFRKDRDANKGFAAEGGVDLTDATIGGDLDCSGGQFLTSPQLPALNAPATKIAGNVFLREGMLTKGFVNFEYADVGGAFEWLDVRGADKATLDLQFAKVGTLSNDQNYYSNYRSVSLNGFAFDRFGGKASPTANAQLAWLHLHSRNIFSTEPYEQLAAALRHMGLQEESLDVMIAKNWDQGQHLGRLWNWRRPLDFSALWDWCWYNVVGAVIGYGYQPWKPFGISIGVILIGWWFFRRGYSRGLVTPTEERAYVVENGWTHQLSKSYPKFNAFVYSLETFVPLVKLGISDHWMPNANENAPASEGRVRLPPVTGRWLRCYLWVHIIAGWVLTTLWVGGLTGLLKT